MASTYSSTLLKVSRRIKGGDDLRQVDSNASMVWSDASCAHLGAPSATIPLLERAIASAPERAEFHAKLGNIFLDLFDFTKAARAFEAALRCDPSLIANRVRLARAYNVLGRHAEVLELLGHCGAADDPRLDAGIRHQRATALLGLERAAEAEAEFRAALACNPHDRYACLGLGKLLRNSGRDAQLLSLCDDLAAQGVDHAQLLLDRGRALALCGKMDDAARLLFDRRRVHRTRLAPPEGFADIEEFNAAIAREILGNPFPLSDFPQNEEANRGSSRVHHLMCGARPELIRALLGAIQSAVSSHALALTGDRESDPWLNAMPRRAHLRPWGLIQRHGDYEDWHTHRGGWLSGVYYVAIPSAVSEVREGKGCIEFGPPPSLAQHCAGRIERWRHAPKEGTLLMAPSHYHHHTVPTGIAEHRISFAFDVVSDDGN
jgi:tetratricopeptide (TPR) repeat protein